MKLRFGNSGLKKATSNNTVEKKLFVRLESTVKFQSEDLILIPPLNAGSSSTTQDPSISLAALQTAVKANKTNASAQGFGLFKLGDK